MQSLDMLKHSLTKLADGGLCVAFSGGLDSSLLLKVACMVSPSPVHALTMYTPFHSPLEPGEAALLAAEYGARHAVVTLDTMPPAILGNPPDRCYLCKRALFSRIRGYARTHHLAHVLDGTNADDLTEYRPGLRALSELGVKSPLAALGLSKQEVRAIARHLGLSVADKPSAPCLATRFPYGTELRPDLLRKADEVERAVKALGIPVVRARIHGDTVRLEVPPADFPALLQGRDTLLAVIHGAGFSRLTLDLAGFRSGSFDQPAHPAPAAPPSGK